MCSQREAQDSKQPPSHARDLLPVSSCLAFIEFGLLLQTGAFPDFGTIKPSRYVERLYDLEARVP